MGVEWNQGILYHTARIWLLLVPAVLFLLVFFGYPVARLLGLSIFDPEFTLRNYEAALTAPVYLHVPQTTLKISVQTTLLCLLLGYPLAYVLSAASETGGNPVVFGRTAAATSNAKTLLLYCFYDVVPAALEDWACPPFDPAVLESARIGLPGDCGLVLCGRGTTDHRGPRTGRPDDARCIRCGRSRQRDVAGIAVLASVHRRNWSPGRDRVAVGAGNSAPCLWPVAGGGGDPHNRNRFRAALRRRRDPGATNPRCWKARSRE